MTLLIDLAAEVHGFNRTEIVVTIGVLVASIERRTGKPPHVTLEEVPESQVLNGARDGRDGAGILAVPLRLRAARQLERDQRAVEEARAALVAAEARAAKSAALVDQLAALAALAGGSHV